MASSHAVVDTFQVAQVISLQFLIQSGNIFEAFFGNNFQSLVRPGLKPLQKQQCFR